MINYSIISWSKSNITINQAQLFPSPSDIWALWCTQLHTWVLMLAWDTNSVQQLLFFYWKGLSRCLFEEYMSPELYWKPFIISHKY